MSTRPKYLGIKLSKEENNAIIFIAKRDGLPKSLSARQILRAQLIAQGVLVYNPAPVVDETAHRRKRQPCSF